MTPRPLHKMILSEFLDLMVEAGGVEGPWGCNSRGLASFFFPFLGGGGVGDLLGGVMEGGDSTPR